MAVSEPPAVEQAKQRLAGSFDRASTAYAQIGPLFFDVLGQRLVDRAALAPGAHVLDVATGTGAVLAPAARQVGPRGSVTGVDFSAGMLAEAARRVQQLSLTNTALRQMDAEQLDLPDAQFDHVLCGASLFMMPRPARALAEFRRVLKPGGRVALSTFGRRFEQACLWVWEYILKYWPAQLPRVEQPRLPFTTAADLAAALTAAGFAEVEVVEETFDFVFPTPELWWTWLSSISVRLALDAIAGLAGPTALAALKAEVLDHLQDRMTPEGVHLPTDLLIALAIR
jgi:O-methyltransferase/aklanonic acid methyltransferase